MPGVITCSGLAVGVAEGICMPGVITCSGLAVGVAEGICMPGVITCSGLAVGDADGIFIPGVITCSGLAVGVAEGIFIPGVITCGLGDGEGLGLTFFVEVRLLRGAALFFLGAVLGFGLLAGFIFDMSCPSCCGKTPTFNKNTSASTIAVRSAILEIPNPFMVPP
jgi:hypothetical protein